MLGNVSIAYYARTAKNGSNVRGRERKKQRRLSINCGHSAFLSEAASTLAARAAFCLSRKAWYLRSVPKICQGEGGQRQRLRCMLRRHGRDNSRDPSDGTKSSSSPGKPGGGSRDDCARDWGQSQHEARQVSDADEDALCASPERQDLVQGPREVVATVCVDSLEQAQCDPDVLQYQT